MPRTERKKEEQLPVPEGYKRCTRCGLHKPPEAFHLHKRSNGFRYRTGRCKVCIRVIQALYNNSEPGRRVMREYRARPDVRERRRLQDAQPGHREAKRAYHYTRRQKPLAKMSNALRQYRLRARRAKTEKVRRRNLNRARDLERAIRAYKLRLNAA